HVEDLRHQRDARLGAAHGDRPRGAVDPLEVDLGDEVVLAADLAGEAVVRLEGDGVAGLDLEDGLEGGPERPDHLVARPPVPGSGRHQASGRNGGSVSRVTASASTSTRSTAAGRCGLVFTIQSVTRMPSTVQAIATQFAYFTGYVGGTL